MKPPFMPKQLHKFGFSSQEEISRFSSRVRKNLELGMRLFYFLQPIYEVNQGFDASCSAILFCKAYVINILFKYNRQYKDMIENISEIVFVAVIGHILARKPLLEPILEKADYQQIEKILAQESSFEIVKHVESAVKLFIQEYYGDCSELLEYLMNSMDGIFVRIKNAAKNNLLYQLF